MWIQSYNSEKSTCLSGRNSCTTDHIFSLWQTINCLLPDRSNSAANTEHVVALLASLPFSELANAMASPCPGNTLYSVFESYEDNAA